MVRVIYRDLQEPGQKLLCRFMVRVRDQHQFQRPGWISSIKVPWSLLDTFFDSGCRAGIANLHSWTRGSAPRQNEINAVARETTLQFLNSEELLSKVLPDRG